MASSKIEKRFATLEQRVAALETLIEAAMDDGADDDAETPAPPDDSTHAADAPANEAPVGAIIDATPAPSNTLTAARPPDDTASGDS